MKRIEQIDALRGFALFGIIMTHMFEGFLAGAVPSKYAGFNIIYPIDKYSRIGYEYLFLGKFYAIFAMLFGLSFYLMLDQKKDSGSLKFVWRLVLLFLIGLINHIHFRGDFLTVYAVFGMVLVLSRKVSNKMILVIGLFLAFNGPTAIMKTISLAEKAGQEAPYTLLNVNNKNSTIVSKHDDDQANAYFDLVLQGEYKKLLISNGTRGFYKKYDFLKDSGRIWVIPGLFLLGLWIGRKKFHEKIDTFQLPRLIAWSGFIGMIMTGIKYYFSSSTNSEFNHYLGSIASDASNIFMPLFYVGLILLLFKSDHTRAIARQFVPVGKMGLTSYILQGAFGILIFYGYGLGLLLKLSATIALGLGLLFFLFQVRVSRWWFTRYECGPFEWLWRSGTNGSWQPMKIKISKLQKSS